MKRHLCVAVITVFCCLGCNKSEQQADRARAAISESISEKKGSEPPPGKQTIQTSNAPEDNKPKKSPEPSSKDNMTVVVEGVGTTSDESLKDAFRNAVRQVVGAVVDAETLVKNDQIISDRVLTYSDGFVKSYQEISKKQNKGVYHTKIKATIERRSVIARLKASNIAVKNIDGKGIFAEVVTQLEAAKNARALLENALEGFPLNVMEAEVIGKPTILEKSDSTVKVEMRVEIKVNKKAFEALSAKLQDTLSRINKEKKDFSFRIETGNDARYKASKGDVVLHRQGKANIDIFRQWHPNKDTVTIVLNTQTRDSGEQIDWRYYIVDKECCQALDARKQSLEVKLLLVGADGRTIATDRFVTAPPIYKGFLVMLNNIDDRYWNEQKGGVRPYWISSFFMADQTRPLRVLPTLTFTRRFTLSLEELKAIESVKCELNNR